MRSRIPFSVVFWVLCARNSGVGRVADSFTAQGNYNLVVESEESPSQYLLNTSITKSGGYQKQQGARGEKSYDARSGRANGAADTLIVWTEENGVDMALSFQEADGCASIWSVIPFTMAQKPCTRAKVQDLAETFKGIYQLQAYPVAGTSK